MVAKTAYQSLHTKVKRNISTSSCDMSLSSCYSTRPSFGGPVFGGGLLPTHLQVMSAESFFCMLNPRTRTDTVWPKSFTAWNTGNPSLHCQWLPNCSQPRDSIELPDLYQHPKGSSSCCFTHLSLVVPCGCITALVQAPWGQGPVGGRGHGLALCSVAPSWEFPPQSAAVLCRGSCSRGVKLLQTPPNALGTCSAVSLASSAFLKRVPTSQAHG